MTLTALLIELIPPPQTATQLLPVRAFTCSVLVSTLLTIVVEIDDDDDDNDDDDGGVSTDEDSCFGLLSLAFKMIGLLPLPTFMMRLFTAACATDLKSASVGGFDKIDTGATEL